MFDGNSFLPPQFLPFQQPQNQPTLVCDFCNKPIENGDEAIHFLFGKVQVNPKNLSPMVLPDARIKDGEVDLHTDCFAGLLVQDLPWVADDVMECRAALDGDFGTGHRCAVCGDELADLCATCESPFEEGGRD